MSHNLRRQNKRLMWIGFPLPLVSQPLAQVGGCLGSAPIPRLVENFKCKETPSTRPARLTVRTYLEQLIDALEYHDGIPLQ